MAVRILLIEDVESLREVLAAVLNAEGYEVYSASSAEEAREILQSNIFDCVLCDFKLPGENGLEFLQFYRSVTADTPFILMTAYGSIDIAVEAMKYGATDFISKPFDPVRLSETLDEVIQHRRVLNRNLGKTTRKPRRFMTQDEATQKLVDQARKVAAVDSSVLLLGESGTGKELLARFIHEQSPRADQPFLAVNCAALPEELLESEFFGHEAGAFTGATQRRVGVLEVASEGTVFLDEVGDMPASLQVKLLRALQEREIKRVGGNKTISVAPRIISATNIDIAKALDTAKLREDFYFRLAVITFMLPPLRERRCDIPDLIDFFANYYASKIGKSTFSFTPEAKELLLKYHWPGNIRELENVIERALILSDESVQPEHLELDLSLNLDELVEITESLPQIAQAAMQKAESQHIRKVLTYTDGNKSKAAKILGVSYKTLLTKIKEYEIESGKKAAKGEVEAPAHS